MELLKSSKNLFAKMMYEKNHGHSQLRIWRVRFWGMSFGDIWWRSTSKTQIRWLILATFIPLAPERGLNGVTMRLPQRNRQKGQIHATSTLHQKNGQQMTSLYSWQMDDTCQTSMYINWYTLFCIYHFIYIYISTILWILYEFCLYW